MDLGELLDPETDVLNMQIKECSGAKCRNKNEIEKLKVDVYSLHFYIDFTLRE
jgi:hypothetical protein